MSAIGIDGVCGVPMMGMFPHYEPPLKLPKPSGKREIRRGSVNEGSRWRGRNILMSHYL